MKQTVFLFLVIVLSACEAPMHEDATALCGCYKQLHKVPAEEEPLMNFIADSCQTMHIEILKKFEGNAEEKEAFIEAYTFCQDEK